MDVRTAVSMVLLVNSIGSYLMALAGPNGTSIVIWPRGDFLFNSTNTFRSDQLSLLRDHTHHRMDFLKVAMQIAIRYPPLRISDDTISLTEWQRIAAEVMPTDAETAFVDALFFTAKNSRISATASQEESEVAMDSKCCLLSLLLVVSFLDRHGKGLSMVGWIKRHLQDLTNLLLTACRPAIIPPHHEASKGCHWDPIPGRKTIMRNLAGETTLQTKQKLIESFDILFEGTFIDAKRSASTASIVPKRFSELCDDYFRRDFDLPDLVSLISHALQDDMFMLNELEEGKSKRRHDCPTRPRHRSPNRSLTSTRQAGNRKISIRRWDHIEILSNSAYEGANLRIVMQPPSSQEEDRDDCSSKNCAPIFLLRRLQSAAVVGVEGGGGGGGSSSRICLGLVETLTLLKRLKRVRVSVISKAVVVDDCEDVTLFVRTPSPVILTGQCKRVRLAPYNIYYDGLQSELDATATIKELSNSSATFPPDVLVLSAHRDESIQPYTILDPGEYFIQPTPFVENITSMGYRVSKCTGTTDSATAFVQMFLLSIPAEYLREWKRMKNSLAEMRRHHHFPPKLSPSYTSYGPAKADIEYLSRRLSKLQLKDINNN